MLQDISMYNLPVDYVRGQEKIVSDMTLEQHKALAEKYIDPNRMYYVIAGDAATQMEPLRRGRIPGGGGEVVGQLAVGQLAVGQLAVGQFGNELLERVKERTDERVNRRKSEQAIFHF